MRAAWFEKNANVVAVLALLVAASYLNSLFNPFMWDDKQMILHNEGIRQGWTSVINAFSPAKWAGRTDDAGFVSFFRPMHTLLSVFDYQVWGLNPFGFHLSNTLVHLFNTIFLFFLTLRLTGKRLPSIAAASIFDYMRLLVVPYPLKAYYTLNWYGPGSLKALAGFAVLIAAAFIFVLLYMSRRKTAAYSLAWPFIALAPVLNIGALGEFSIAERYLYIPSIGFSIFAGLLFANFMKGGSRTASIVTLVVLVAGPP